MYDPTIGRWISEDPLGFEAADTNLYRYVENEPNGSADPSGLKACIRVGIYHETVSTLVKQPEIIQTAPPLIDWSNARPIQGPNGIRRADDFGLGRLYTVSVRGGGFITAWRPEESVQGPHRYWCHGFTFGGASARNGPFSFWGDDDLALGTAPK